MASWFNQCPDCECSGGSPPQVALCDNCGAGEGPKKLCVVLAGFVNSGAYDCAACWPGTWLPKFNGMTASGADECCRWICPNITAADCGRQSIEVLFCYDEGEDNYYLEVRLTVVLGLSTGVVTFRKDYGDTKPDCLTLADEDIPFVSSTAPGCDMTGATCTVSAMLGATDNETDCCGQACYPSSWPETLELEFEGFGNDAEVPSCCDECDQWNGTWLLTECITRTNLCGWGIDIAPPVCGVDRMEVAAGSFTIRFYAGAALLYTLASQRDPDMTFPDAACATLVQTVVYDDMGPPLNVPCALVGSAILGDPPCSATPPETECCDPNSVPVASLPCRGTLAARCTSFGALGLGTAQVTFRGGPARSCDPNAIPCAAACCGETELPMAITATVAGILAGGILCDELNGDYPLSFFSGPYVICNGDGPTHDEATDDCKWVVKQASRQMVVAIECGETDMVIDAYLYQCQDVGIAPKLIHWQATVAVGDCQFADVVLSYVGGDDPCGGLLAAASTVTINV